MSDTPTDVKATEDPTIEGALDSEELDNVSGGFRAEVEKEQFVRP